MKISRHSVVATGFVLGLASLSTVTSGCSLTSPKAVTSYQAGDGANLDLGGVKLLGMLVVAEAQGKPGVLVGAVSTEGAQPVDVNITVLDGQSTVGSGTVTATPNELTQLGTGEGAKTIQLSNLPVPPGATLTLKVSSAGGGQEVALPVVPPTNQYQSIAPPSSS